MNPSEVRIPKEGDRLKPKPWCFQPRGVVVKVEDYMGSGKRCPATGVRYFTHRITVRESTGQDRVDLVSVRAYGLLVDD